MGGKLICMIVVLMVSLSGCSLFVAQPLEDENVCVNEEKLTALLDELGMTVDDLESGTEEIEELPEEPGEPVSPDEPMSPEEPETPEEPVEPLEPEEPSDVPVRTFTEGELVKISPKATDAEGDTISFTYTSPLDADGEWQTEIGDAGEYMVTVTASDGKASVSRDMKIVILSSNNPPVIEEIEDITIPEGDTISFSPVVSDPEGDDVTISYSGFMSSATYTTTFDDAGEYFVTITASDGTSQTVKRVKVTVTDKNRAPVLAEIDSVTVLEGEMVAVVAEVTDEDEDDVSVTYSAPLSEDGEWQTDVGDAGTYLVTVTATDGVSEDTETFTLVVESLNTPPELELDDVLISIGEGETETVLLEPVASDADGDDIQISYSGWMNSNSKSVTVDDAGDYEVTVTAKDGIDETKVTITVTINAKPSFDFG